jgi:sigma-B regulation protein RsbU (phosphoserine phosphatase)
LDAWEKLQTTAFDLVLLDLIMPKMEGYEILRLMRSEKRFSLIPVLMISGMDQDSSIVRCIEAGADDYLTKPVNPVFLKARIATCLEKKRLRDQEQRIHAALVESQQQLADELREAGRYVACLLPAPINNHGIHVDWHYQSCSQLGGDGFGYRWIDKDHWCFFLFDVCGHGVGAALLSISVLNVMRTLSLPSADFRSPKSVLDALNTAFPMESNNEQYFTIWYGVFTPKDRRLTYGSAGHPAVLSIQEGKVLQLRTKAPPIGCIENARFQEEICVLEPASHLILLSDGVYELERSNGSTATLDDFAEWALGERDLLTVRSAWEWAQRISIRPKLDDDFSILDLRFA